MSAWDRVQKSPAVRLPIAATVPDYDYYETIDAPPERALLVWAHRLDRTEPPPSPEHAVAVALDYWAARHPKEMAKWWSRWADARRAELRALRWEEALRRRPGAARRRAALLAARRRFLAARGRA